MSTNMARCCWRALPPLHARRFYASGRQVRAPLALNPILSETAQGFEGAGHKLWSAFDGVSEVEDVVRKKRTKVRGLDGVAKWLAEIKIAFKYYRFDVIGFTRTRVMTAGLDCREAYAVACRLLLGQSQETNAFVFSGLSSRDWNALNRQYDIDHFGKAIRAALEAEFAATPPRATMENSVRLFLLPLVRFKNGVRLLRSPSQSATSAKSRKAKRPWASFPASAWWRQDAVIRDWMLHAPVTQFDMRSLVKCMSLVLFLLKPVNAYIRRDRVICQFLQRWTDAFQEAASQGRGEDVRVTYLIECARAYRALSRAEPRVNPAIMLLSRTVKKQGTVFDEFMLNTSSAMKDLVTACLTRFAQRPHRDHDPEEVFILRRFESGFIRTEREWAGHPRSLVHLLEALGWREEWKRRWNVPAVFQWSKWFWRKLCVSLEQALSRSTSRRLLLDVLASFWRLPHQKELHEIETYWVVVNRWHTKFEELVGKLSASDVCTSLEHLTSMRGLFGEPNVQIWHQQIIANGALSQLELDHLLLVSQFWRRYDVQVDKECTLEWLDAVRKYSAAPGGELAAQTSEFLSLPQLKVVLDALPALDASAVETRAPWLGRMVEGTLYSDTQGLAIGKPFRFVQLTKALTSYADCIPYTEEIWKTLFELHSGRFSKTYIHELLEILESAQKKADTGLERDRVHAGKASVLKRWKAFVRAYLKKASMMDELLAKRPLIDNGKSNSQAHDSDGQ
ncbi:hypothetical protein FVE85_4909 [Porphyridium purpureum]|uniref:Uncharacterized protein n=1 Tax=Porphyridium purpureum TaxID=35688 RepID=A0A5J4YSF0_PORPP|nr:hypothetical protein FVE85_4909 [Porphyridium purpureum]|eukprot:POR4519..scf236_6